MHTPSHTRLLVAKGLFDKLERSVISGLLLLPLLALHVTSDREPMWPIGDQYLQRELDSHILVLLHDKLVRPEVSLEDVFDLRRSTPTQLEG